MNMVAPEMGIIRELTMDTKAAIATIENRRRIMEGKETDTQVLRNLHTSKTLIIAAGMVRVPGVDTQVMRMKEALEKPMVVTEVMERIMEDLFADMTNLLKEAAMVVMVVSVFLRPVVVHPRLPEGVDEDATDY